MVSAIGDTVKAARERVGLKQKDVAARIGVHPSKISHWESGKNIPNYASLERVADALGMSVVALLGGPAPEEVELLERVRASEALSEALRDDEMVRMLEIVAQNPGRFGEIEKLCEGYGYMDYPTSQILTAQYVAALPPQRPEGVSRGRILIVQDSLAIHGALRGILESEGYEVVGCRTVDDALSELDGGSFDLMILEVLLSGRSGLELLRAKEEGRARLADLPVVVFSALPRGQEELHMVADAWMEKPGDIFEILGNVERLVGARRGGS